MNSKQELIKIAKPILFNTKMIKAIIDGKKTVTSRNINPRLREGEYGCHIWFCKESNRHIVEKYDEDESCFTPSRHVNLPYKAGDIVYVRETYTYGEIVFGETSNGDAVPYIEQRTDEGYFIPKEYALSQWLGIEDVKWKPSIHMPKSEARIFLRITNVEIKRLNEITEPQARKEGFNSIKEFIEEYLRIYPDKTIEDYIIIYEFERIEYV